MVKVLILFLIFCVGLSFQHLYAQNTNISGEISSSSNLNPDGYTPFWLWANQLGQVPMEMGFGQSVDINFNLNGVLGKNSSYYFGSRVFGLSSKDSHFEFTELYAGLNIGKIYFNLGAKADPIILAGLSSSNGNFLNSRNARPYPSVSIGTKEYLQIGERNFFISGKWEEAILFDDRKVDKPKLHHKNLFLRFGDVRNSQFEIGIDHYAFWGGDSEYWGKQPERLSDYWKAIVAIKGSPEHTIHDQRNVSGNSLGQYLFIFRKNWEPVNIEARLIHPFELKSGMLFQNGVDNIYGLFIEFNKLQILNHLMFEFIYTRDQDSKDPDDGEDYYFNHFLYSSGFTYKGKVMGMPFFYPLIYNDNGVVTRIDNNRVMVYHLGADGKIFKALAWKLMLSYAENYGSIQNVYENSVNRLSGLFELKYGLRNTPLFIKSSVAWDKESIENMGSPELNTGFRLTLGGYLK